MHDGSSAFWLQLGQKGLSRCMPFLRSRDLVLILQWTTSQKKILCFSLLELFQMSLKIGCPSFSPIRWLYMSMEEYLLAWPLQIHLSLSEWCNSGMISSNWVNWLKAWFERGRWKCSVQSVAAQNLLIERESFLAKEYNSGNFCWSISPSQLSFQKRIEDPEETVQELACLNDGSRWRYC